jgi:hypothetical protein
MEQIGCPCQRFYLSAYVCRSAHFARASGFILLSVFAVVRYRPSKMQGCIPGQEMNFGGLPRDDENGEVRNIDRRRLRVRGLVADSRAVLPGSPARRTGRPSAALAAAPGLSSDACGRSVTTRIEGGRHRL